MAKTYKTALIIEGDAKDGIKAVQATEKELNELNKVQRRTIATTERMNDSLGGLKTAAAGIVTGFVLNSLVQYSKQAVETTAQLGNMSDATGVSAEKLQELHFAMRQFNSEAQLDDAIEALTTIADKANDAASGTKSFIQDFGLIGITVEELRGKDPVALFKLFAEAIQNTENSSRKMTAATRILGDDLSIKLMPLLSQGADGFQQLAAQAHAAGVVLSNDLVDGAQEADRAFKLLTQQISTEFKREALSVLTDPETIQGIKIFGNAIVTAMGWAAQAVADVTNDISTLTEDIASLSIDGSRLFDIRTEIEQINRKIGAGALSRAGVFSLDDQLQFYLSDDELKSARAKLEAERDKILKSLGRDEPVEMTPITVTADAPSIANIGNQISAAEKLQDKYADLTSDMGKQIALFGKTSKAAELRYRLEFGDLAKLSDSRKQHLLMQTQELQALRNQKDAVQSLFPALIKLRTLKQQADQIDSMGGSLGNLARKQLQGQIGSIATGGAPGMVGLDATINGPFGELSRLEQQRQQYEQWYRERLSMLREFQAEKYGITAQATAAIEQLNQQHHNRTIAYEQQTGAARAAGISQVLGNIMSITSQFAGEQSGLYKAMFIANKAASIAQAIINTETAATKALTMGPILGIPASTLIRATGYASIGLMAATTLGQLSGQAHDGIDSIPSSGTWNLQKGERIIDRRTNADLKEYLSRANGGTVNRGGNVTIPISVEVNAQPGMDPDEARKQGDIIAKSIDSRFRMLVVDEKRPGGLLANTGS